MNNPMSYRVLAPDNIVARIGIRTCCPEIQSVTPEHVPPATTHGSVGDLTMQLEPFRVPPLHVPRTSKRAIRTSLAVQMFGWENPAASLKHLPPLVAASSMGVAASCTPT
jgi:hypothetical protein